MMNIIFLTMNVFTDIEMHNIYSDLMKEFVSHGHKPYIVTPREKRSGEVTQLVDYSDYAILKVGIGNTSNVSFVEKGISTILLEKQFMSAINKHLRGISFQLILYSTPPITLANVVKKLKRQHDAPAYLMLKDIFPQNAVDLQLFKKNGLIHKYFRYKERNLYKISDYIGCMSPANEKYLLDNNKFLSKEKIHLLPNGIKPHEFVCDDEKRITFKKKYNIPYESTIFMYGGNLGKPQDIPFFVECLKAMQRERNCFFIVCGTGSEYKLLNDYVEQDKPKNFLLINGLPKDEYDEMLHCCDVGLLFLDHRFTIPNFPSRMLSYMECAIPVLACTDSSTDIGEIIEKEKFGLWCESNNTKEFVDVCRQFIGNPNDNRIMGERGRRYLESNYSSERVYEIICERISSEN